MAITVKKTFLWKKELDNHPGAMAEALEPLADGGADLRLIMVCRFPDAHKGAVEVHPISERTLKSTAKRRRVRSVTRSGAACRGDNRQGLGYALAKANRRCRH
jgi:hypothetical protein